MIKVITDSASDIAENKREKLVESDGLSGKAAERRTDCI